MKEMHRMKRDEPGRVGTG